MMSFYFLSTQVQFRGVADVWNQTPTKTGIIFYSVITPILCICGIAGNTISLMVLKRKELVGSAYTYLAVLACVDLGMSIYLFLGGLSRGIMWHYGWGVYDSLIGLPLGAAMNTLGAMAIVGLTIDRVINLWNPVQCTKPKFCNANVARKLMSVGLFIAIVFSVPYCFIYEWTEDGKLTTTRFFDSKFYKFFNWFTLLVFSVLPAIILFTGNGFLIISLRRAKRINKKSNKCRTNRCKRRDHTNLTVTLVMIIVFFMITNVPENLVSRTAAINLLFQGDHEKAVDSLSIENLRQICTILGAIDVNTNFIFYYTFCPAFCKVFQTICKCRKRRSSNTVQVNVFVLNANGTKANKIISMDEKCLNKKIQTVMELSRKKDSAIALNITDEKCDKSKGCDTSNCDYIAASDDYMDLDNDYTPPFSTITEEPSSSTISCVAKNSMSAVTFTH